MDTSITLENLKEFRRRYEENTLSQVVTRAASKAAVNDICYDTPHAQKMNHKFSVDVPTMGACNQSYSGRLLFLS